VVHETKDAFPSSSSREDAMTVSVATV
jgi:hypothetical protein